jgi:glycosyltransferase involved in cell wall biosynthesis
MNIYYIANARMPTEKAHGIQTAKMCEAFIEAGASLTLVIPTRRGPRDTLKNFYNLRVEVPTVRLRTLDWYNGGRFGYFISSLSFICSYVLFVWRKKRVGEKFVLYTVDNDNYSLSCLALLGVPFFSEMHGSKSSTIAQRALFKGVRGIIAINRIIVDELKATFSKSSARYIVEPNGVDLSTFSQIQKKEARTKLGLPEDACLVLYAGRFFEWKGLEILPRAAKLSPHIRWQTVGGDEAYFKQFVQEILPLNLFFAGGRPHTEMPLWFAAADALLVLGTKRDIQSYRYTSPMKLFEYLAVDRPIVAAETPALREIVSEKEVTWYKPDDAEDLSRQVAAAMSHTPTISARVEAAKKMSTEYSWKRRAERILAFISAHDQ